MIYKVVKIQGCGCVYIMQVDPGRQAAMFKILDYSNTLMKLLFRSDINSTFNMHHISLYSLNNKHSFLQKVVPNYQLFSSLNWYLPTFFKSNKSSLNAYDNSYSCKLYIPYEFHFYLNFLTLTYSYIVWLELKFFW